MRRHLRWIVPVALVVGVAAALVTAWFPGKIAALRPVGKSPAAYMWFGEAGGLWWSVILREDPAETWARATGYRDRGVGEAQHAKFVDIHRRSTSSTLHEGFAWPAWSRFDRLAPVAAGTLSAPDVAADGVAQLSEYANGWPVRAFAGAHWKAGDGAPRPLIREGMTKIAGDFRPTRVLWLGLVVNVLVFGVVAGVLLVVVVGGPGVVRGIVRRRAGLCTKCGYARVGLGEGAACPECGGV